MKKYFSAPLLLLGLASCRDNSTATQNPDQAMSTDFDALVGWVSDGGTLSTAQAHSGRYSLTVDSQHEFSINYSVPLSQLSNTRFRGVQVDAWIFVPDKGPTAQLVAVLKDAAGTDIMHENIDLGEKLRGNYGQWIKISREVNFPATANADSRLVMYLWRANAPGPTYLDDLQLTSLR